MYVEIGTVRKLNSVLFPIKYSEKFYHDVVQPEVEEFCKLSMFHCYVSESSLHTDCACTSKFITMMCQ